VANVGNPPAHLDSAAMNGAQLLVVHRDSFGMMSGPPAAILSFYACSESCALLHSRKPECRCDAVSAGTVSFIIRKDSHEPKRIRGCCRK
jgi:hypothetical protein